MHLLGNLTKDAGLMPFQDYGFARITPGLVFQLIYVHQHRFGNSFTIEVVSRPLYYPTDVLILTPGNRLYKFASKGKEDKWWECTNAEQVQESFTEIRRLLRLYAFPFFEATRSGSEILKSRRKNIFGRSRYGKQISWGTHEWDLFDTGHLHLWNGNLPAARNCLNQAHEQFSPDSRDWAKDAARDCLMLLALTEKGATYISSYLDQIVRQSRRNLGLDNWSAPVGQNIDFGMPSSSVIP